MLIYPTVHGSFKGRASTVNNLFFFWGVWKILSEFFKALIWEPQRLCSSVYSSVPHPYDPLSQRGEVYGTTGKLSFLLHLLQSHLLLFSSHSCFWIVEMNLSDHTALGWDFHSACMAWDAANDIWNCDAGNFLKRWKCNMQKGDLADTLMFGIWNGKISMNGMFCYLSVCIAAGGTVSSLSLH